MQFKVLALLSALAAIGSAQDIDNNDVPNTCRSVCQSTIDLTTQCDRQTDDDDEGYINCVCSTTNASSFIPECEACVAANDEADNDVRDIVRSCSFTQVSTWNSGTATGTATSSASTSFSITLASSVTATATSSGSGTGSSASSQSTGTTSSSSSSSNSNSNSNSASTGSAGSTASAQATGAAAPAVTAGFGGIAVAILAGVPAFL
ncbi:gpi anchored protein [Diplodia corticola]|uniref:Gpi anchored protein n=1 Tax=Diplodia corticola TaxID=236234 RepID=A0A1J9S2X9_9PEZI|nr:gpi anchored protein [Diplodia corticola]OJD34356.1 gpi anchored protein [Diplodia corticola]